MSKLRGGAPAPDGPFPVLPLRTGALFPDSKVAFMVGRPRSLALIRSLHIGDVIGVVSQRDAKTSEPGFDDFYPAGTYARVVEIARKNEKTYQIVLEGLNRFDLVSLVSTEPYLKVSAKPIDEVGDARLETRILAEELESHLRELSRDEGGALADIARDEAAPGRYADAVAAGLGLDAGTASTLIGEGDSARRLRRIVELLGTLSNTANLRQKIQREVRESLGKQQKEVLLREQLKAIRKELNEQGDDEFERIAKKLEAAALPEEVQKVAARELGRLEATGGQGPEANVIRNYLDWIASLPWDQRADTVEDIDAISAQLDADHAGLDDVKKRILEHMAVQKLSGNRRGTILCLVGPPGVGKTSLGQSIADATGRPFVRVALGGVRDEADVRGHRRTYIGALPGRLIHGLKKAGVKNPVMLLDEIDKLGSGWNGSPEAALLEVLDPEQNSHFTDHYLDTEFDLSEVLFVCTANTLQTLSPPLRDRLEIVELAGYTQVEKSKIARSHLLAKRRADAGIPEAALTVTDAALDAIVADYTREAGVRQLDRELMRLCRSIALKFAKAGSDAELTVVVDKDDVADYLGKPKFRADVAERTSLSGVATGLAWTPVGGDILFIETSRMPGKGRLEITGQLGDVMKESARAALTYVRSHANDIGLDTDFDRDDIHIHVPAGAVPKDGPSAGVTMFTALASLLSGRKVRSDTAMTGECTLRGRVLPVGGIKAKVLAAHRAGIRRVILPKKNEIDLDDVPEHVRGEMTFIPVSDMSEVLESALEPADASDPTDGLGFPDAANLGVNSAA